MRPFKYSRAAEVGSATRQSSDRTGAKFLAGGTNILDLMKEGVETPDELIDISNLPVTEIKKITQGINTGGISIGGLGKNTDAANHPLVRASYPLLAQSILAGASAQIRNMATNGGNLNQRTRCPYFYDVAMPCNKRAPGTGCGALEGVNRTHAIFGWTESCVAVHPSDMCIALAALDAVVKVQGVAGASRSIPFSEYHRLPGTTPEIDNNLQRGEMITAIEIPPNRYSNHSYYLKVRDRASYAFAVISVAAALDVDGSTIRKAGISLGGVAHKPWRAHEAEQYLLGKAPTEANFTKAAALEMVAAKTLEHNKFKVELGQKAIVRALMQATKGSGKA
ncbi:MAG: xanthine dehydrogenase family protein subunit M [Chitinophagaceae bacterium]